MARNNKYFKLPPHPHSFSDSFHLTSATALHGEGMSQSDIHIMEDVPTVYFVWRWKKDLAETINPAFRLTSSFDKWFQ